MESNQYQTDTGHVKHNTAAVEETQEIDLLLLFDALRRHILVIIATALLFALVAGIVVQFFITPLYTATTSTYLATGTGGSLGDLLQSSDLTLSNSIIGDYSAIIKSRTLLGDVIERMDLPYSYKQLYDKVSVTNPSNTHIIKITVTDPNPYLAKEIANELTYYAVEQLSEIMGISVPSVYDEATVPTSQSYPSLTKSVVIAFVIGGALAAGVIVFISIMDTTVKTAEDIENRCGMVTLTKVYYEGGRKKKFGYGYGYGYGYKSDKNSSPQTGVKTDKKPGGAKK